MAKAHLHQQKSTRSFLMHRTAAPDRSAPSGGIARGVSGSSSEIHAHERLCCGSGGSSPGILGRRQSGWSTAQGIGNGRRGYTQAEAATFSLPSHSLSLSLLSRSGRCAGGDLYISFGSIQYLQLKIIRPRELKWASLGRGLMKLWPIRGGPGSITCSNEGALTRLVKNTTTQACMKKS